MKLTRHVVCLCFGRDKCTEQTKELAERNHAFGYEVDPVDAPHSYQPAYRGTLLMLNDPLIPVCVYCDTTPWYTEADLLIDNTCDLLFPESIVREYFRTYLTDENDPARVTFETWYADLSTADDTDDLYDFALSRGFTATRPNTRKEN